MQYATSASLRVVWCSPIDTCHDTCDEGGARRNPPCRNPHRCAGRIAASSSDTGSWERCWSTRHTGELRLAHCHAFAQDRSAVHRVLHRRAVEVRL